MKNEDVNLRMYKFIRDLGYTGVGARQSNPVIYWNKLLLLLEVEMRSIF